MVSTIPSTCADFIVNNLTAVNTSHVGRETVEACPICKEIFSAENPPVQVTNNVNCSHIFGRACLIRWVSINGKNACPVCRAKLYGRKERKYWIPNPIWTQPGLGRLYTDVWTHLTPAEDGDRFLAAIQEPGGSFRDTIRNDEELERVTSELGLINGWAQPMREGGLEQEEHSREREEGELLRFSERALAMDREPRRDGFLGLQYSAFLVTRSEHEGGPRHDRGEDRQANNDNHGEFAEAVQVQLDLRGPEDFMRNRLAARSAARPNSF
ncbi:uncharacterized protein BDZ99DRAFT_213238 [Mytilinidion resinicola]|uniref:RING-type domain-containing protein n=1 Tax=Mytilinidion resinicola TaxID=574789 RepID=A0A6A6XZ01_9PEZI|nr:uncharacterized protein BDZ99DRAFT_213238 [Mytilinidion resinicola]KAF2801796.1 hypothetical protein BDZ99DRAFT_213238 [Mytilinidion resinicola]